MTSRQSSRRPPMTLAELDAWIIKQEAKKRAIVAPDPHKTPRTTPGRAILHQRHRKDTP